MEDNFSKLRIYCPEHQKGFEVESGGKIYCENGKHFLASEFPPLQSYLEYCCGCQRFIPFSITGEDKKSECANCERQLGKRYFCHYCQTLTNDIKKTSRNKEFGISASGEIIPNCPACSFKAKEKPPYLHKCEVLKTEFYTSREVCEFCHISTNAKENQLVISKKEPKSENKDDTADKKKVLKAPNFIIVKDVAPVEKLEDEEEITVVKNKKSLTLPIEEVLPIIEPELELTEETQNTQDKPNTVLVSCMVVLGVFVTLIVVCSYISNRTNQTSENGDTNNSNSLSQGAFTPNKIVNNGSNLSKNSTVQVKSSFRDNSSITIDGAELREEPEYNSYVISSVEKGTKIRVINQKSSTSPWYKIKTETGEEGWIHGDYIDTINWSSLPCSIGETGVISGGNLRSSPKHSVNEANILAIWDKGTKVKILELQKGEPGAKSGNPYWYEVKVIEGNCSLDKRNSNPETDDCRSKTQGYINSFLVVCD